MPKWTRGRVSTNEAVVETAHDLLGGAVDAWNETVETVTEKTTRIIQEAKIDIQSSIIPTIGKIANKVLPSALAASASLQYMGSQGSFVDFLQPAYLQTSCFHIEADKHVYIGWPCHKTLILGSLSGFTLCENAQVELIGATVEELEIVKQFLESGVYIE